MKLRKEYQKNLKVYQAASLSLPSYLLTPPSALAPSNRKPPWIKIRFRITKQAIHLPQIELVVKVIRVGLGGQSSMDVLQCSHMLTMLKICC